MVHSLNAGGGSNASFRLGFPALEGGSGGEGNEGEKEGGVGGFGRHFVNGVG